MRRKVKFLIASLGLLALTGCAGTHFEPKPHILKMEPNSFVATTASLRTAFLHDPKSGLILCVEPSPDAAFSQDSEIDVDVSLVNFGDDEDTGKSEASGEVALGGRSPSVLLAREMLFRMCEFSRNHGIDQETAIELYKENLNIIQAVSLEVAKNTKITVSDGFNESVSVRETEQPVSAGGVAVPTDGTTANDNASKPAFDQSGQIYCDALPPGASSSNLASNGEICTDRSRGQDVNVSDLTN